MAIQMVGYRPWQGRRRSPWAACWPMVRTGLTLVLRRKIFWFLLGLALITFLFTFAIIYTKAVVAVQNARFSQFLDRVQVTGTGRAYLDFMSAQGTVTMVLLAFAGSLLVGGDYRQGGLAFYLSKRIGLSHYLAGKLLAIASLVSLVTTLPALVLYAEYGFLTDSLTYFRENARIILGILGYGAILAAVLSLLLAAVACWVPRTVPLVMTWACIFLLLPILGQNLRHLGNERRWLLLDLWGDMRLLGSWCFGSLSERNHELAGWSAKIVLALCVVCLALLVRRARATEVVR